MKGIGFWNADEVPYGLFSNFAETPIVIDGDRFLTVEHYFQAEKASSSGQRKWVMESPTPKVAKARGRDVILRPDWEQVKDGVMYTALVAKAQQSKVFKDLLLSTADAELFEDSPFDYYWGVGRDGSGKNMLGKLLMKLRQELRSA